MKRGLIVAGVCALTACGGGPTAPVPDGGPPPGQDPPSVSAVTVASPIGFILAVGGSAALTARATDAAGSPVATSFAWSSDDERVATVSTSGRVTAVTPGATTIRATADGVEGTADVTVADADLDGLLALFDEPLADGLIAGIAGDGATPLDATWTACGEALDAGDLTRVRDCVLEARRDLDEEAEPSTGPLRGLMSLFLDWADRLLDLN